MKINFVGKRHPPFHHWEPIYIGTNEEPTYDERLTWEGRSDKMVQVWKDNISANMVKILEIDNISNYYLSVLNLELQDVFSWVRLPYLG